MNRIFIASDHAGYALKGRIKEYLKDRFEMIDLGCDDANISVDYPDFSHKMAENLSSDDFGILICGTGIGISIAANRHENIRCALCHDSLTARLAREHNNANVIAFGARMLGDGVVFDMLDDFFATEFAGGRHQSRVNKINLKDKKC